MPEHDLPSPQDASADEPVTDSDQKDAPTPQGRADNPGSGPEQAPDSRDGDPPPSSQDG